MTKICKNCNDNNIASDVPMRQLKNLHGLALVKEKKRRKYLHADNVDNLVSNNKVTKMPIINQ